VKLAHLPPASKDIIDAVLMSGAAPLTDSSCASAGTEPGDKTVARYLAGFMAELNSQDARNALMTSMDKGFESGEAVYICRLMVRHAQGEDVWSWGLEFSARQSDGVIRSYRCIGAG
jgi:hypothetical protein